MEPNKFEENIRTKLEERELQPSAEAWSTLEAQLGASNSSNKTMWYAIAASLVAILVVGSFLLKDDNTVSNEIVEETNISETVQDSEVATSEENNALETSVAEDNTEVEKENVVPKKKQELIATTSEENEEERTKSKEKLVSENIETTKTSIAKVDENKKKVETVEALKKEDFIALKVTEVVAQVENLKNNTNTITPEDVEALLQKAQRDIANQRLLEESTVRIDPASLLNDVESELERGFRDKVFDALGEGFNVIRTAVVERNN